MDANDNKTAELAEMVRAIRERVRANYPSEGAGGLRLPDLMPVVHARDSVEGKVAAIGTVNPRPPGIVNSLTQSGKRVVARALDWHVREQVEFNRAVLATVDALIETHNDTNRALAALSARLSAMEEPAGAVREITGQWAAWRNEWQQKLNAGEIRHLRAVAELQQALQLRASQTEAAFREALVESRRGFEAIVAAQDKSFATAHHEVENRLRQAAVAEIDRRDAASRQQLQTETSFREMLAGQHRDFTAALQSAGREIQERLWADLERARLDSHAAIHRELRLVRQGVTALSSAPATAPDVTAAWPPIDWMLFAEKFRGQPEAIRAHFERYADRFAGSSGVLDLGCGRGEFLDVMRSRGVPAKGIDLNAANLAVCRSKGFDVEQADLFHYLENVPDASVGGIFCAQVIEHLQPPDVPRLVALGARKLRRGAALVFETPNPECLAIFATHFYVDPTHIRPLPPVLMAFYLEEAGLIEIQVERFAKAEDSWPVLQELPEAIRIQFFGYLDYSISARNAS